MGDVAGHRWDASQRALPAWSLPKDAVDVIIAGQIESPASSVSPSNALIETR